MNTSIRTWSTKSHESAYTEAKRLINLGRQYAYYEDPEDGHTFSYVTESDIKTNKAPKEVTPA